MKVSTIVSVLALATQFVSAAPAADIPPEMRDSIKRNLKRLEAEGEIAVRGVGYYHERHLKELEAEMKRRGIPLEKRQRTKGVEVGGVKLRREIRDFMALTIPGRNVKPIDLFMLALATWYTASGVASNPLSYWQVAGIHGQPYQAYGSDGPATGDPNRGYCPHGSTLFPTWHRPYLALVEQRIWHIAKDIANNAKYQKYDWLAALDEIRLPYYDPGDDAFFPEVLFRRSTWAIPRHPNTGNPTNILNPLYQQRFHIEGTWTTFQHSSPRFRQWRTTLRNPTSEAPSATQNDELTRQRIWANRVGFRSRSRNLLLGTGAKTWDQFSNSAGGAGDSVESLHDILHVETGGDFGHMTQVPFSSFDPIFWLHHCNIDHLFAMWQRINPGVNPGSRNNGPTFSIRNGELVNGQTPLKPFRSWGETGNWGPHWTGNDVMDWRRFGYDYADAPNQGFQRAREIANERYPNFAQQANAALKKRNLQRRGEVTGDIEISNKTLIPITDEILDGIEKSIHNNKYSDYRIECAVDRTALGEAFSVRFFKGRPPKNPKEWPIAENLLGSYQVLGHNMVDSDDPNDNLVSGIVPITETMMPYFGKDELHSLDPKDVIAWLIKNLKWRVEAAGERVPVRKVKGLSIKIARAETTLNEDGSTSSTPYVEIGEIVRKIGTEGGDLAPGVLPPTSRFADEEDLAEARRLGKI